MVVAVVVGFDPRVFLVRRACRANLYFGSHVSVARARTGASVPG